MLFFVPPLQDMITVSLPPIFEHSRDLVIYSTLRLAQAHSSYWADPNLAAFLLAEIFSKKADSLRTGLGVR